MMNLDEITAKFVPAAISFAAMDGAEATAALCTLIDVTAEKRGMKPLELLDEIRPMIEIVNELNEMLDA